MLADFSEAGLVREPVLPGEGVCPSSMIDGIINRGHPWQLASLNLGRFFVLGGFKGVSADQLEQLFRHSLKICRDGGETVLPMALLALSELYKNGFANEEDYRLVTKIWDGIAGSDFIDRHHFRRFFDHDCRNRDDSVKLLEQVVRERTRLFPFTYR